MLALSLFDYYFIRLVEEAWLLVFDTKLTIDGSHDTLKLTHGEHTAKECVAGIVAMC